MLPPEPNEEPGELEHLFFRGIQVPAEPVELIILAVCVIVPLSCMPGLVARQYHGNPLGKDKCCHEIALLPFPQLLYIRIIGRTLDTAIPAKIFVRAVAVFLAIGFVMFPVITYQIQKGEAVVRGHKIYAGIWAPSGLLVQVTAAGNTTCERASWLTCR